MIQQFYFSVYAQENWNQVANWYLHTSVPNTIVHNSQKVETIQMPIKRWTDKQNVI